MSTTKNIYEYKNDQSLKWREKYKNKIISAEEAVAYVKSGDKVAVMAAHGTPNFLLETLVNREESLDDVTIFTQLLYDGGNIIRKGYEKGMKNHCLFLTNTTREDCTNGFVDYVPSFLFEAPRYYDSVNVPDIVFMSVSMPDENGLCSFSLNADVAVMSAKKARIVIAQINKYLPRSHGSYIPMEDITWIVEHHEPIKQHCSKSPGEIEQAISSHISPLISDGDTLQVGIGSIPDAVLGSLHDRKNLGVHTEMFSDGMVDLYNSGAITNDCKNIDKGKIVSSFIMGTEKVFDFVDDNPEVLMLPVDYTNDPRVISKNDNFVSINACLEVDLYGQVNSDTLFGNTYTGCGGQIDFVRGASMSKGGKSILAMPSTAAKGTISRIKCRLGEMSPVTTSRYDVHYICTEYGIVDLRGKTVSERARLLISIAHPDFREQLLIEAKQAGFIA